MKKNTNLIYGKNPVIEALRSSLTIEKVLINNRLRGEVEKTIRRLCKEKQVPLVKVPMDKLDYLSYKQAHQGVAAFISPITFAKLEDVLQQKFEEGKDPLIVVLEGVSDVRNAGAIARSAYAFDVDAVVFPMKNSARINDDTVKISAGALLNIPVCREQNMSIILDKCRQHGLEIVVTDVKTEELIGDGSYNHPCAIVMGSEDRGITPETRKEADRIVKIPHASRFDSLNVSVATGIVLYEVFSQRNKEVSR